MPTGIAYDKRFMAHDTGRGHPERPERMTAVVDHLAALTWRRELVDLKPTAADLDWVAAVHSREYIRRAKQACESGQPFLDSMDVAISRASYDIALLAAGAPIVLADKMMAGDISNGFALLRPPGHHAEHSSALGFCLFNNVAILAKYLQRHHGLGKVAIMDWDVHHGNGTQHTFEDDPSVLYLSTHQYPYYPGTGAAAEIGEGRGRGSVVNCPMPAGATDSVYEVAFTKQIIPAMESFKPEAVIISAGFDAHRDDPLADINLSTEFFGWMCERLLEVADNHANGRLLAVLEGGYNLNRIGECVAAHLDKMRAAGSAEAGIA